MLIIRFFPYTSRDYFGNLADLRRREQTGDPYKAQNEEERRVRTASTPRRARRYERTAKYRQQRIDALEGKGEEKNTPDSA